MIGVAVSVPLFSNQEDYVGYVPKHWPSFGDSTPIVGFVLSAVLYVVLRSVLGTKGQEVEPQPTRADA